MIFHFIFWFVNCIYLLYTGPCFKKKCYHFVSAWVSPQPSLREVNGIEKFPSSAYAITGAINSVASSTVNLSFRRDPETKELFSGPSEDFLELCQQQLSVCDSLMGANANAKFTVSDWSSILLEKEGKLRNLLNKGYYESLQVTTQECLGKKEKSWTFYSSPISTDLLS